MKTRSEVTRDVIFLLIAMLFTSFATMGVMKFFSKPLPKKSKPSVVVTVPTHGVQEELESFKNSWPVPSPTPVVLAKSNPKRVLQGNILTMDGFKKVPYFEINRGLFNERDESVVPLSPEDVTILIHTTDGRRWVSRWDPAP